MILANFKKNIPNIWVGLGNPGPKYALTRHNYGKIIVETFKNYLDPNATWSSINTCQASSVKITSENFPPLLLARLESYMNLSGKPTAQILYREKKRPENLLVIHDDLELPVGEVRLKFGGGCGGHNGLKDICLFLKTKDFWRLRIGISRPVDKLDVTSYVLSSASTADDSRIRQAALDILKEKMNF